MTHGYNSGVPIDTDSTLANNSDQLVPSQKAINTHLTSGYVPYTGANSEVDLGAYSYRTSGVYIRNAITAEGECFDFRDTASASTALGYAAFGQMLCDTDGDCFIEHRNNSVGEFATAEFTLTNSDTHYGGVGIVSTGYADPDYTAYLPNMTYLYSQEDDVLINAAGVGKKIYFGAGGYLLANVNGYWGNDGLHSYITVATGYDSTATSAGTKTLTQLSPQQQFFTGTSTHTCKLPQTSTLTLGQTYRIVNKSTGVVSLQTYSAAALAAVPTDIEIICTVISIAGDTAAAWDIKYAGEQSGSFTVQSTTASTPPTVATPTAWGPVDNLSAAPSAVTGSGNVVTVTNSTAKIECTVNATGIFSISVLGNNNGATTSPFMGFRFRYNGTQQGIISEQINNTGYYNDVLLSTFGSITAGQLVDFQFAQLNGTGARSTTFRNLTFAWTWKPT